MAGICRQKVSELHQALATGSEQNEVYEASRSLVGRVVLTPVDGALTIDLHGEIAEILKLSTGGKKHGAESEKAAKQLVSTRSASQEVGRLGRLQRRSWTPQLTLAEGALNVGREYPQ